MARKVKFYNSLKYHRRLWGYSLRDIAYLLDLTSTSQIIRWEKGYERPNADNLLLLVYIYRTPCEVLFSEYRQLLTSKLTQREQALKSGRKGYDYKEENSPPA